MPRRSAKSRIPQIPPEIWRPLYLMADQLRALALWEELDDADLLGVDHPHTGEPLLGVMMGSLGQIFGLALHHGPEGLRFALEAAVESNDEPDMEEFHLVPVLKVEFVPKSELTPEEKRRVKEMNFQPAPMPPRLWPNFQSVQPGYAPWHLELAEAEVLLHALPRISSLGAAMREFYETSDICPVDEIAFWPRDREPGEPLQIEEIEWRRLRLPSKAEPKPVAFGEETERAVACLPQADGCFLELDASTGGMGVIDDGNRPWLVKMGIAAEARSGTILAAEMASAPEESIETLAGRTLARALERARVRPAAVRVCQVRIQGALEPICARLGIRLELRRELPAVKEFRAATSARFA